MQSDDFKIKFKALGQVGYRFNCKGVVIFVDPYLSNSVQEKEDESLARLMPIPIMPAQIDDADLVLITHEHRDHCDEDTLIPLSKSSPNAKFIGPPSVLDKLVNVGIDKSRINLADHNAVFEQVDAGIRVYTVPSAHPCVSFDDNGYYLCVGYVIECGEETIYHAGDTSVSDDVIKALQKFDKIDVAFIPVNERNYYRDKQGILGNMSVREAFQFAVDIGAKTVVPTHWDMFEVNQVYKEEIQLIYDKMSLPFQLLMEPKAV